MPPLKHKILNGYCASQGNNINYEWISKVELDSYTNSSNAAKYSDFTNENIELTPGATVDVTLTPGFASSSYSEYWKIWIDYNGDSDFEDAGEEVFNSNGTSVVSGTFTVKSTASGTTRMRVSMKYNGAPSSCETFSYGEVEDYTINFTTGGGDVIAPTAPSNLTYSNLSQTSLTLSWTASTDNVGVSGYDVYQDGNNLGSVTGTSANITGLTAGQSYSFYVKAKDAAGNISNPSNTINVTTVNDNITYCSSKGSNSSYEWIDLVQLKEIDNTTAANNGYADFTNMTANVARNESVTIYISCGFASSSYTEYWSIWIDWNQDGTFSSDEQMVSGSSSSSATLSASFTVPSTAVLGQTRMRVSMKYNGAPTACETFSYGEVEDYTINVSDRMRPFTANHRDSEVIGNEKSKNLVVYPNPANNLININCVNRSDNAKIRVFNNAGIIVKTINKNEIRNDIDISNLSSGTYIINVIDGNEVYIKKFIKK